MEQKRLKSKSTLDLIKNEIQKFQHQHLGKNSWCAQSSSCAATNLVERLINIVENEEEFPAQSQSQSPEQKAFTNSIVVRQILRFVDARSLLKLREVSRLWKEEATSFLLSPRCENYFCVRFMAVGHSTEFTHDTSLPLSDFIQQRIDSSNIFPCSQFIFFGGQLSEPTLTRFFSDFGHLVQQLTLSPESVDAKALRNILFKWTPNLKSLVLNSKKWPEGQNPLSLDLERDENEPESKVNQPLILSKLQKFQLPEMRSTESPAGASTIYEILTSAPNLISIEDPLLAYVPQIVSAGKISLLKSVRWSVLQNCDLNSNFFRFVQARPEVTSVTFEHVHSQLASIFFRPIHTLFVLSQNTLENIGGIQRLGQISDRSLKFLPLPKVTQLKLTPHESLNSRLPPLRAILPKGHTLAQFLPNLKFLHVENEGQVREFQFFSPNNSHAGLQELKISNFPSEQERRTRFHFNPEWLNTLGWQYENVTSLHIAIYKDDESILNSVKFIPRSYEKLQQLTVELWIKDEIYDNFRMKMDQSLTGLSGETYRNLLRSSKPDPEFQKLEVLAQARTGPSILELKDLTKLTFDVHFERESQHLWSQVAQFYAFQPMVKRQGLEVKVGGSQKKSAQLKYEDLGPI